ncbi:MAG: macrolide transporter [Bdellovibrionales bacterium GWB1_55_8]|nr:MAG: macrolide transporter [Bdellovibrionales bacterium GWB1_55_8]
MKKKWILSAVLLVAMVVGISLWARKKNTLDLDVREVPVARGDINVTILATGIVQPKNRLEIKPPVAGRAEKILAREGERVRKGQILAWMSSTERAALLDAARAKGQEEVTRWEEYYKPTPVVAPIDGTIILRNIESGQSFTNQDAIFVMSDRLSVKAQVDETDLAQIRLGQPAIVTLDAYPSDEIEAAVRQIAFDAKTVNNVTTYIVDVIPERTPPHMRSGMTANVRFDVSSAENVLFAPTEAIRLSGDKQVVRVRGPKNASIEREVATGLTDGKRTEVLSGLQEGDILLITGIKSGNKPPETSPFSPMRRRSGGARR